MDSTLFALTLSVALNVVFLLALRRVMRNWLGLLRFMREVETHFGAQLLPDALTARKDTTDPSTPR